MKSSIHKCKDEQILKELCSIFKKGLVQKELVDSTFEARNEEEVYQEGINIVNEIKPTQQLLNEVVASLNKENSDENKSNTKELKIKAYSNEYTKALQFYNDNKEKYEDLSGERKICLQNTLINKFHKEVRKLSKGKL